MVNRAKNEENENLFYQRRMKSEEVWWLNGRTVGSESRGPLIQILAVLVLRYPPLSDCCIDASNCGNKWPWSLSFSFDSGKVLLLK